MRFLTAKDFIAGVMFVAFGALGLFLGADYRAGTAARMGPGYMPRLLCWAMVALGAVVMIRGMLAAHEPIDRGRWRPITLVTLGIIGFALLIDPAGLLAAGAVLLIVGALGGPEFKWKEVLVLTVLLLAVSVGVFIWGLGLPITVLPRS